MNNSSHLQLKIKEYKTAIEKYNNIAWYRGIEVLASMIVITLQSATIMNLFYHHKTTGIIAIILTVFIAYVVTDFISGLVHMIMDNNTNYSSIVGPFVATFHLHHHKLTYQNKHPIKIYFYESGHKFWLVIYLLLLFIIQCFINLSFCLNLCLITISLMSSLSELSHFWCHNSPQAKGVIGLLQKYRILLSMNHHKFHHRDDNTHYAFLNGMTDPVLNVLANYLFKGYKNHTDKHVAAYVRCR